MTEEPTFHKGQTIWWNISVSRIPRPSWIPKKREWQAGWIRDVDNEGRTAAITIMNESREFEGYIVPMSQLKARSIA